MGAVWHVHVLEVVLCGHIKQEVFYFVLKSGSME